MDGGLHFKKHYDSAKRRYDKVKNHYKSHKKKYNFGLLAFLVILLVILVVIYLTPQDSATASVSTPTSITIPINSNTQPTSIQTSKTQYLSEMKTDETSDMNGSMLSLTNLDVECPDGGLLNSFAIHRGAAGNTVYYDYQCLMNTDNNYPDVKKLSTQSNANGSGNTIFLDRHDVRCDPGYMLNGFGLKQNDNKDINYNYGCVKMNTNSSVCVNKETKSNDDGSGNVIYLDRHQIACDKDEVLSNFHLIRDGSDKYKYQYQCCKKTG